MKSAVIIFPGSNCDRDMDVALKKFGFKNEMVWHDDEQLPKSDLIVLPGGFSYGDYLRCGSIAGKSKIIKAVIDFAAKGGLVLGICNGFQILTEPGLLPGVLQQNKNIEFICKNVFVKVNNKNNKYFKSINKDVLELKKHQDPKQPFTAPARGPKSPRSPDPYCPGPVPGQRPGSPPRNLGAHVDAILVGDMSQAKNIKQFKELIKWAIKYSLTQNAISLDLSQLHRRQCFLETPILR